MERIRQKKLAAAGGEDSVLGSAKKATKTGEAEVTLEEYEVLFERKQVRGWGVGLRRGVGVGIWKLGLGSAKKASETGVQVKPGLGSGPWVGTGLG